LQKVLLIYTAIVRLGGKIDYIVMRKSVLPTKQLTTRLTVVETRAHKIGEVLRIIRVVTDRALFATMMGCFLAALPTPHPDSVDWS